VIVRDGKVMVKGRNLAKQEKNPTAHGEMVAIRRFLARYGPDTLKGTTLYTSGESCVMCMGAILWCGISRLIYGASLVGETARTYLTFVYLGVFAGLGFGLVRLGLATGVAVAIAGALAVAGLVGYVRWLKPWLTARKLRPLAFLDDEAA